MSIEINKNTKTKQHGFSLMEVLVSLILISFGLLALVGLQTSNTKFTTTANLETKSMFFVHQMSETLRSNRTEAINGEFNTALTDVKSLTVGKTMAETARYDWFSRLNTDLPNSTALIDCSSTGRCLIELRFSVYTENRKQVLAIII